MQRLFVFWGTKSSCVIHDFAMDQLKKSTLLMRCQLLNERNRLAAILGDVLSVEDIDRYWSAFFLKKSFDFIVNLNQADNPLGFADLIYCHRKIYW